LERWKRCRVNTFLSSKGSPTITPTEVIRATTEEKEQQIETLRQLHLRNTETRKSLLHELQDAAIHNTNMFDKIMEVAKICSLGEITGALFEVGGQYRRNM